MRERASSAAGRGRVWVMAGAAIAVMIAAGLWPAAEATQSRAGKLELICTAPGTPSRKAMAIDELRRLDTSDSRQRLASLADSTDDRVAVMAISALGRTAGGAASNKLKSIYEATTRSDAARGAALSASCVREQKAQHSWGSCRSWVRSHAGTNARLSSQANALKAKLWPQESSDE